VSGDASDAWSPAVTPGSERFARSRRRSRPGGAALVLEGVFSVLPTPFHDGGALDPEGLVNLVRAHVDAGVAGLTALGVMGEAAELSEAERSEVLDCAISAAGDVPVVVGVTGPSADVVADRARLAARCGAGGLMVSPSRTLDVGAAVEAATAGGLPIVIQDYPAGSGVELTVADLIAAAEQPLVVGVKAEAPPTAGTIAALRVRLPRLGLAGGLGGLFLIDELRAGASGLMTGFALPDRLVSIIRTFPIDPAAAEREWLALLPLMRFEAFQPGSLAARKEVWRLRGVIGSGYCRRRGAVLDDVVREDVRRAFELVTG
jgi:4-hydroxy-tetrahydrodipicolinate synthase